MMKYMYTAFSKVQYVSMQKSTHLPLSLPVLPNVYSKHKFQSPKHDLLENTSQTWSILANWYEDISWMMAYSIRGTVLDSAT